MSTDAGADAHHESSRGEHSGQKRKRSHSEESDPKSIGMGHTLSLLRQPDLPEFSLTSERPLSGKPGPSVKDDAITGDEPSSQDWETVTRRPSKKHKKIPKQNSGNYPTIQFSAKDSRLNAQVTLNNVQGLVLYILADGTAPQFVSVRHRSEIRKVVVLMVPGLEKSMLDGSIAKASNTEPTSNRTNLSPDDYYPKPLDSEKLPESLRPFADMFEHWWPVKTPGDDRFGKMHSPLQAMLTVPLSKSMEYKNQKKEQSKNGKGASKAQDPPGWKNKRTPVTDFFQTSEELLENDYTLHPAMYQDGDLKTALIDNRRSANRDSEHGWVDTLVNKFEDGTPLESEIEQGSLTAGRTILAMDCEMCKTDVDEFSLTRISIVGWDGSVILDELVKPDKPITDYLTMYSGITEKMLEPVTTTLADIQKKLLDIFTPHTVLLGHSLNSDFTALKLTHPFIIDTAIIFPHPRGPPLKSSLKWLAQKYLTREIQKGHGTTGPGAGHDSVEDARTCLDLLKQKCEKGKDWGTSDATGENMFKRLTRTGVKYKNQGGSSIPGPTNGRSSAAIDWGDPRKGAGAGATYTIGCKSDEEVTEGVIRAVKGDPDGREIPGGGVDFVFGRLRELEALKGWWNNNKLGNIEPPTIAIPETKAEEKKNGSNTTSEPPLDDTASQTSIDTESANASKEPAQPPPPTSLPTTTDPFAPAVTALSNRISRIHASLPPCTAFIVYSGSGDPREMSRLQALQTQFKREYKIKKWDQLSVKWTDTEEQALKRAVAEARQGVAFMGVK